MRGPTPRFPLLLLATLLLAAGCGETPTETSLEARTVEEQRALFRSRVGSSYAVDFQNNCFCGPDFRTLVRIEVRGGVVQSVVAKADQSPIPRDRWSDFLTVEQVFDTIAQALNDNAASVRVTYDETLGYPTDVFIDFSEMIADEERGFTLQNLTAL